MCIQLGCTDLVAHRFVHLKRRLTAVLVLYRLHTVYRVQYTVQVCTIVDRFILPLGLSYPPPCESEILPPPNRILPPPAPSTLLVASEDRTLVGARKQSHITPASLPVIIYTGERCAAFAVVACGCVSCCPHFRSRSRKKDRLFLVRPNQYPVNVRTLFLCSHENPQHGNRQELRLVHSQ